MVAGIARGFKNEGTWIPDHHIAGEFPRVARYVTVTGGERLTTGMVLGKITESGIYQLSSAAATDGSQVPDAILAEDVDARRRDVSSPVWFTGEFSIPTITLGEGHTLPEVQDALRGKSIFLRQ